MAGVPDDQACLRSHRLSRDELPACIASYGAIVILTCGDVTFDGTDLDPADFVPEHLSHFRYAEHIYEISRRLPINKGVEVSQDGRVTGVIDTLDPFYEPEPDEIVGLCAAEIEQIVASGVFSGPVATAIDEDGKIAISAFDDFFRFTPVFAAEAFATDRFLGSHYLERVELGKWLEFLEHDAPKWIYFVDGAKYYKLIETGQLIDAIGISGA